MKPTTCLGMLFLMLGAARAEMATELPAIEVKPKPADEVVQTTFKFRNKGSKPVKILDLESSCSCLSAEMDKAEYQPGEEGTGKAEFKVSTFVGRHEKLITALTDDPEQKEWVITFILDIPAVVDIEPKTIQWWVGDEPVEKTTTVKMNADTPMTIKNITATRDNVEFSWKEVTPGREYLVTVKPKSTKDVTLGALKIETDSTIPKYQRQLAFFSIYNKPAEPAKPVEAAKAP
ncbi:MAG: DUF1573 domain-containing protein [Verrucomicrobiaceae bacterium]|nr:DUF1573 domain-containing protein [Verrucomicrobiaceae bacterium]